MKKIITIFCIVVALTQVGLMGIGAKADSIKSLTNVTFTPTGELKLSLATKFIEDDFGDELKISYKKNVIVDTATGEIRLSKTGDLLINKTFGGIEEDWGHSVQQTSDGGYIISGGTESYGPGEEDAWLIKTDSSGNEEWNKTFGGSGWETGISVQQTSDGGYVIGGGTNSSGADDMDIWLIKTDGLGNEQWNRTFDSGVEDYGYAAQQTSDGGYIIVGCTNYIIGADFLDVWLIKTDSLGNEQWNKTFGGSEREYGLSVRQTSDGGYIVVGATSSFGAGNPDAWLLKTDSSGNEQWNKTFGWGLWDFGQSVQQTSDSGYIIAGLTNSTGAGDSDAWLIKTDGSGNEQWNKTFGGSDRDEGQTALETSDGGYIMAGTTNSSGASYPNVWLIKTDNLGNEEWNKIFGGNNWDVSSFHWFGHAIQQTSDDEYVVAGGTRSYGAGEWDVWLIKINASGKSLGNLVSANLLSGQDTFSIDAFNCTTVIPTGSGIKVQFSQDNHTWYSSNNDLNQWDTLSNGFNSIDLSGLGWQDSDFYYKMELTSETSTMPTLQGISVLYSQYVSSGTFESERFDSGTFSTWKTLNWSAITPPGTELKFQLQSANTYEGLGDKTFTGPEDSSTTFYTTSGQSICECHESDRWLQYKAFLSTTNLSTTPVLEEVSITYRPTGTDKEKEKELGLLDIFILIALTIAIIIIALLLVVNDIRKEKKEIEVQELPPEKIEELLEKQHADGKITDKTYEDIKVLLKKYRGS